MAEIYITQETNIPFKGYFDYILPLAIPKTGKTKGLYPVIQAIMWDRSKKPPFLG
jgi:hypothetical protein